MQAVELLVYLVATIVIAGAVFVTIQTIDEGSLFDDVHSVLTSEQKVSYQKVVLADAGEVAYRLWNQCGLGSREAAVSVFVTDSGTLTNHTLAAPLKKFNLCQSLQMGSAGCGLRNDVVLASPIATPAIVEFRCNSSARTLEVS